VERKKKCKKIFFIDKILEFFFVKLFFMVCGPSEAAPLDTACFWIEDSMYTYIYSQNRLALNGISAINHIRFFENNSNFFFSSKNRLKRMLKKSYHGLFLGGGRGGNFAKIFVTSNITA